MLIALNFLILIFGALEFFRQKFEKNSTPDFTRVLKINYLAFFLILGFTVLQPYFPTQNVFEPPLRVWSAPSAKLFSKTKTDLETQGFLASPFFEKKQKLPLENIFNFFNLISLLGLSVGMVRLATATRKIRGICHRSTLIRSFGKVQTLISNDISVPFSYRNFRSVYVVLPTAMILNFSNFKMAVKHELQHHRQGDTFMVYFFWLLSSICFFNPVIHFWRKRISEIQELACDQALVKRETIDSQAYARCLFEVAKSANHEKGETVCAAGFSFVANRKIIKRRIEMILDQKKNKSPSRGILGIAFLSFALFFGTAFASKNFIQDRRVSMNDAQAMLSKISSDPRFPVTLNKQVLSQLNLYLGTPEGRTYIKNSLARMQGYRQLVLGKLDEYKIPDALKAIPIVESGYRNLTQKESAGKGAGLWQFIPGTARAYGLRVDEFTDDRINESIETDAAMRYLTANYMRFKDWRLSVLAYNIGENSVQKGIDATGSRDPWVLIEKGYENDWNYLARVMAAILILENQYLLD